MLVYPEDFQGNVPTFTLEKNPASVYPDFLLPQGGRTILDVSSNVNEGSEEKLCITEAEARCAIWVFLPVPRVPGCPTTLSKPNNASMET